MNFDFQQMKPLLQREFDEILSDYPTDLQAVRERIPHGGDAYQRKRAIVENAARLCPVRIFPHYPFAFALDVGEPRHFCFTGIGKQCYAGSGVDFGPLHEFRGMLSRGNFGFFNDYTDFLHNCLDYDKLLTRGFRGVYEDCCRLNEEESDPEKKRWRQLVMDCCLSVEHIGLRLRREAEGMLPCAADEDARYNLNRMVHSVNTPWEPAVTMFDALNSILCASMFITGLDGVEMNAYGQIDRLIEPYYRRDREEGLLTEEEAYFLLQCFLHRTDLHCHFDDSRQTYDNGFSVMIGGCDPAGRPVYNDITRMILRAYTENKLFNPKLNARASAESPREYLEGLAALMQTGNNNLVVENDDYIIPMFCRMGLAPEDARTYVGNGCQEVICRSQLHSRAFTYLNLVQILLDTLRYDGKDLPPDQAGVYRQGAFQKDTFDRLYTSYLANLRSLIGRIAREFARYEEVHPAINPEPMLSAFTDDCVARGKDRSAGGARYNHKTLSLVGFGTLCDSLLSLRKAYAEGRMEELLAAMDVNFAGAEALRHALKTGNNRFGHSEEADAFARTLAGDLAEVSRGIVNARGIEWRTSLFTYYQFKPFGQNTAATPDGRLAGEPFSRQMNMAALPALTTAARSMAVLTDAAFCDVGMFDIALPLTVSNASAAHQALTDFIRTCLLLKLPVLQPNVADARTMREERAHKGTHPDLVVRICGYSARFGQLPSDMQDELISRIG